MARLTPLWQTTGNYPAQLDRQLIAAAFPGGRVIGGAVTAVANTMNVSAAAGWAAVPLSGTQGAALCRWDAPEVFALAAAPGSGQTRIDRVIVQVRDTDIDAGANNDFVVSAVRGVGGWVANPPATPANALALFDVTVPGQAANLNGATLTDRRPANVAEYNLAADTDVTTAAFTNVLSGTFTPTGSAVRVDLTCTGFNVAVSSPRATFQITNGTVTKWICAPAIGTGGLAIFAGGSALFTGLTPGQTYTFTVQVASGAGTFRIRAGTQPGLENMRLLLSNAN